MKHTSYVIIINTASKGVTKQLIHTLRVQSLKYSSIQTKILYTKGNNIQHVLKKVRRIAPRYIIACGGDGTVRAVAEYAYKNKIIFGVIPAGTLNHFARSIKLPLNIEAAINLLYGKHQITQFDIGIVNGNLFVNNSSVGMYSKLVKKREQWQQRYPKGIAMVLSAVWQLLHIKRMHYAVNTESFSVDARFSLIMVGNGRYIFSKGSFKKQSLQSHKLLLYMFGGTNILHVLQSLIHLITGRYFTHSVLRYSTVAQATIIIAKSNVSVALDGEVVRMTPPLVYRLEKQALDVIAPSK